MRRRISLFLSALAILNVGCISTIAASQGILPTCDGALASRIFPPGTVHDNVFDSKGLSAVDLRQRQKAALEILAALPTDHASPGLVQAARAKLAGGYSDLPRAADASETIREELAKTDRLVAERDALEFAIRTFRSQANNDSPLRLAAVEALGRISNADFSSMETLLPLARGAEFLGYPEIKAAGESIQRIHALGIARENDRLPGFHLTARNWRRPKVDGEVAGIPPQMRDALRDATILKIHPLSQGNANSTWLITLKLTSGKTVRAVFKPFLGEVTLATHDPDAILFTREIQAYDFYEEYFEFPHVYVPETLEATIAFEGSSYGVGSLQLFAEGKGTVNSWYLKDHPAQRWTDYWKVWQAQRQDPRWKEPAPWIRVFDWVIGNQDRFPNSSFTGGNPNNILMSETDGPGSPLSIALIDNGNGRRALEPGEYGTQDLPSLSELTPAEIHKIESFDDAKDQEIRARFEKDISANGLDVQIQRLKELVAWVREKVISRSN